MIDKKYIQGAKAAEAVKLCNENPSYENTFKLLIELGKFYIENSNITDEEKEVVKDWSDLTRELFASKNPDLNKARIITSKLLSDIDALIDKDKTP